MPEPQFTPALFPPGQIVATSGALEAMAKAAQVPNAFIARHLLGDWGDLDAHDIEANAYALKHGMRILSAYRLNPCLPNDGDNKLWVITEADRSVTTLLLPSEY